MIAANGGWGRLLSWFILTTTVSLLATSFAGAVFYPADSVNIVAPLWWAGGAIALPLVAIMVRPHRVAAVALLVCHAFAGAILFSPLLPARAVGPEATPVRMVTYNMYGFNSQGEQAAQWIIGQKPDFVVLLEATRFNHEAIELIRRHLPYAYDCSAKGRCSTIIFSRTPAQDVWPHARGDADNRKALSALTARFVIGDRTIPITGVHLKHPWPLDDQADQLEELGNALANFGQHGIMTGDFNSAPWTFALRRLAANGDFRLASGPKGSWPAHFPAFLRLPLDQVYLGRCATRISVRHGPAFGSDHLPVVSDLALVSCQS